MAGIEGMGIPLQAYNQQYDEATKQQGDIARYKGLQALSQMMQMPQGGGSPMGGGQPGMPPQGPPMGGGPPGGGMPPGGGPPMGGAPGGGGMQQPQQQGGGFQQPGQGPLDWRTAVQAIQRANPGAPPNVLAAAVDGMIPLMNADSQQQWRQIREQIMMMATMQKPQLEAMRQEGATGRTQMQQEGATGRTRMQQEGAGQRAQLSADTKTDIAQDAEAGRMERAEAKPPTAAQLKEQEHEKDIKGLVTQIDSALTSIDESQHGGAPVTGLGGTVQRMYEFGAGTLGMDDSTKASDFQTKIRMIQTQLPRMLINVGKISGEERAHLDDVVRGLGRFTNAQQAKSALEYVKSVLQSKLGQPQGKPGGAPRTEKVNDDGRAAAKQAGYSDEEIDAFLGNKKK